MHTLYISHIVSYTPDINGLARTLQGVRDCLFFSLSFSETLDGRSQHAHLSAPKPQHFSIATYKH